MTHIHVTQPKVIMPPKSAVLAMSSGIALLMFAGTAQAAEKPEATKAAYQNLQLSTNVSVTDTELTAAANLEAIRAELFLECQQVKNESARLACYDKVAQTGSTPTFVSSKQPLDLAKTFQSTLSGNPQVVLATEYEVKPENNSNSNGNVDQATFALSNSHAPAAAPTQATVSRSLVNYDNTNSADSANSALEDSTIIMDEYGNSVQLDTDLIIKSSAVDATADQQILDRVGVSQSDVEKYTPLSLAYDLDKNNERGTWTARPYRPMYLLPIYANVSPNRSPKTPTQDEIKYTDNEIRPEELKLQISVKTKVAEDLFDTNADLWFGYTQQSHWQVYNEDNSRPFRATDYEPEFFLTQPVTANLPFGGRLRMLGAGAVHHSNGQSDPLSRSWNRIYVMGGAEWGKLSVIPRLWTRVTAKTSSKPDDNPDIEDYMGYGDVTFLYNIRDKQTLGGTLRYNPSTNKGALQLDYIHPLANNINGYVQLFQGYGESIIDYNHENTGIGVGVVLNDWKGF